MMDYWRLPKILTREQAHDLVIRTGLQQTECARLLRISARTMRRYLDDPASKSYTPMPYAVQVCLELLARERGPE